MFNSGTAQRTKPCSHELLNGVLIMGIYPGEPKRTTFLRGNLLALASSMHISDHHGAYEFLWVIGLDLNKQKVELLCFWSLESSK